MRYKSKIARCFLVIRLVINLYYWTDFSYCIRVDSGDYSFSQPQLQVSATIAPQYQLSTLAPTEFLPSNSDYSQSHSEVPEYSQYFQRSTSENPLNRIDGLKASLSNSQQTISSAPRAVFHKELQCSASSSGEPLSASFSQSNQLSKSAISHADAMHQFLMPISVSYSQCLPTSTFLAAPCTSSQEHSSPLLSSAAHFAPLTDWPGMLSNQTVSKTGCIKNSRSSVSNTHVLGENFLPVSKALDVPVNLSMQENAEGPSPSKAAKFDCKTFCYLNIASIANKFVKIKWFKIILVNKNAGMIKF